MIKKIYLFFHRLLSEAQQKDLPSAGYWQEYVRKETFNLCKKLKGRILEVGCGEGFFLEKLQGLTFSKVIGIDKWYDVLNLAKDRMNNGKIILISADATKMIPLRDNYFDVVICINVLLNLKNKEEVFRIISECARVCKKEGIFIFEFRNKNNPFVFLKYKFAHLYDYTLRKDSLKSYSFTQIRLFLENSGFKIRRRIKIGYLKILSPIIIIEAEKL